MQAEVSTSSVSVCVGAYTSDVTECEFSLSSDNPEEGPPSLACFIIAALCPLSRRWLFMEQTAQGVHILIFSQFEIHLSLG